MNNKKDRIRKTSMIIGIIALCAFIIVLLVFWLNKEKNIPTNSKTNHSEERETGHFYGKPSSVEDISSVEISYNNGRDYISINDYGITYFAYDNNGNIIEEKTREDVELVNEINNYIFDNDLEYLNDYDEVDDKTWSLRIDSPGVHCLTSGQKDSPSWFNELLNKLEVEKYGYIYEEVYEQADDNQLKEIVLESELKYHVVDDLITISFNGIKEDNDSEDEEHYRYTAQVFVNGQEIDSKIFNNENDRVIWSENYAASFKVIKVNNVYLLDSYIAKQFDGHYILIINSAGEALASYYDVGFKFDKDNKKYIIEDCGIQEQENNTCSKKEYEILDSTIKAVE